MAELERAGAEDPMSERACRGVRLFRTAACLKHAG